MANHFVRLGDLCPNTVYYFVIADSEGRSQQLSFRTLPADPSERLSIIAGGDSRNYRDARRNASGEADSTNNQAVATTTVSSLVINEIMPDPSAVDDTAGEWRDWLDDWQETIGSDGRLFPIVTARGNHEISNTSLIDIFDIPSSSAYYALSFGGNLLRVYTLNTMDAVGGAQAEWLEKDA